MITTQVEVITLMPRAYGPAPEGEKKREIVNLQLDLKPSQVKCADAATGPCHS